MGLAILGTLGVDAVVGAGLGAGGAAITGGDPGMGALTGGIGGAAIGGLGGSGGIVDAATGLGAVGSDALVGAGAGLVGAGITGGSPLTGALTGGIGGAATGALGDLTTPSGASASGTTAPGASAASIAPVGGTGGTGDLTAGDGASGASAAAPVGVPSGGGTNLASLVPAAAGTGPSGLTPLSASPLTSQPITAGNLTAAPAFAGGAGVGGAGGGGSSVDNFFNNPTWGTAGTALEKNALPILAGGGLLANLVAGSNPTGETQLKDQAGALATQGGQLASYLQSGQLPPGAQAGLDEATKSAQAAIRSKYAALGMSGSTAEIQDLNDVTMQASAEKFQIADSLLKTGIQETGLSSSIYENLANFDVQQSGQTGSAIAALAAALSGSAGGLNLRIGG